LIDDLTYEYQRESAANQLRAVSDTAPQADTAGYPKADPAPLDTVFAYGPNGNRIADSTRGQYASYNYFNVPDSVRIERKGQITWHYAAGGEKLSKTTRPKEGGRITTHYVGGFVYESARVGGEAADTTLRYTSFSGGRVLAEADTSAGGSAERGYSDLTYEYHLTDHLGNTRVAFEPSGDSLRLTQRRAYYPHGLRWARPSTIAGASSRNEHLYNGKELVDELSLNWYHYGARYYDVALARWTQMDPADQFHSPYSYVGGDPVNLVDPDGRQAEAPGCTQGKGPTTCNVRAAQMEGLSDISAGSALIGGGLSLDAFGGFSKAAAVWRAGGATSGMKGARGGILETLSTMGRVEVEKLAGRNMRTVARIGTGLSRAAKFTEVGGLATSFVQAAYHPGIARTPGFALEVGLGGGAFLAGTLGAPVTATVLTVGGVGYVGADLYCGGSDAGVCGTFNHYTESKYSELYNNMVDK
jgi:RHS repeat-associated protein